MLVPSAVTAWKHVREAKGLNEVSNGLNRFPMYFLGTSLHSHRKSIETFPHFHSISKSISDYSVQFHYYRLSFFLSFIQSVNVCCSPFLFKCFSANISLRCV
jgi:hypothetical protein